MRIDAAKVCEAGGLVEQTFRVGPLEGERGAAIESQPVTLRARLTRASGGFDFEATLEGAVTLECVRCLEPTICELSFPFHLTLVSSGERPHGGETQIQDADCDVQPLEEGKLDLVAIAREQIYLQIPLKPVCSESCRGLCVTCGENLNPGPCGCSRSQEARTP